MTPTASTASMTLAPMAAAAAAGSFSWIVAEYVLHRFVGHGRGHSAFATEHRLHHARGGYFAPTRTKVAYVLPVWLLIAAIAAVLSGPGPGLTFALALGLTYSGYEILHRRLHTHAPRGPVGRWLRRHHFRHHFHDPAGNHGVTVHLLDRVAGTQLPDDGPVRVPERLAMRWLLDPDGGRVLPEYAADYTLVRRASRDLRSAI
jgi:hypothetical protein